MKVEVYVDWCNEEILSKSEMEKVIQERYEELTNYQESDEGWELLAEMLSEDFNTVELFDMSAIDKAEALEKFDAICRESAKDIVDDYSFIEIDV